MIEKRKGQFTVADRVTQYGEAVRDRLWPYFQAVQIPYPPARIVLLGLKEERLLVLYASAESAPFRLISAYPILAASGRPGPKLEEGDRQVPEGLYRIEGLNPNSRFHLSLKIDYPNAFDRRMADAEGRHDLGGDIFIHGAAVSIGCLAMGNRVAEELFVLVAETGPGRVRVILTPWDFREKGSPSRISGLPPWIAGLYREIALALAELPRPAA